MLRAALPRPRRILLAFAAISFGVLAAAGTAQAATAPPGGGGEYPVPCQYQPYGCRSLTSFPMWHGGGVFVVRSTFPASATGIVRYSLSCADGYTSNATVAVSATTFSPDLYQNGNHQIAQPCTVVQDIATGYITSSQWVGDPNFPTSSFVQFDNIKRIIFHL
jgi:hypothetical protein